MTGDVADPPRGLGALKSLSQARIALGRAGNAGVPTAADQRFRLDHARAREAVWTAPDWPALEAALAEATGLPVAEAWSRAETRAAYLARPDLGRLLSPEAETRLASLGGAFDVAIVVADGLSATAVAINAAPLAGALVARLRGAGLSLAPLVAARQARVALGDPAARALRAQVVVVLVGERPGLTASDSLGAYLTFAPEPGTPDSARNCVSNIREGGLSIAAAAETIAALVGDMLRFRTSGVALKDAAKGLAAPESRAILI